MMIHLLMFLALVMVPENGANLKRYFLHGDGSINSSSNSKSNSIFNSSPTGHNFKPDPHWNGTYIKILGGHHFHSSTSTLSFGGSGSTKQNKQVPLVIDIKMGFMIGSARKPKDEEYSRPGLTIAGGLTYALYHLQQSKFFGEMSHPVNINFLLSVAETYGDEDTSLWQVAQLWKQQNVSVIIGPQETCLHEARLASSLNIPMISYFCSDEATSDKQHFPTFSRSRPPDAAISRAVASLVLNYGWCDSLTVIYSDSTDDQRFKRVAKSLSLLFQERGVSTHPEISYRGPYHHGYGDNPFDGIVAKTKDTTRIYIIISEYFEHLGLVLALKKKGLLESGEYLVIGVSMDDFKTDKWNPGRYFGGLLSEQNEKEAPYAFRSYLGIVASAPKNFTEFSRRVNHFMEMEPFHFPNPISGLGYKNIRIEAAYLYDAVMLYANVIRDMLQEYFWSVFSTSSPIPSPFLRGGGNEANNKLLYSSSSSSQRSGVQGGRQQQQQQRLIPQGTKLKLAIRHRRDHVSVLTAAPQSLASGVGAAGGVEYGNTVSGATSSGSTSFGGGSGSFSVSENGRQELLDGRKILEKIRDGREVSRRLRNIRYQSATGHETKMDENGDAEGNFTLVALKNRSNEFGLYPVGFFMRSTAQLPELTLTDTIDWVAGGPPVSQPECGFHGEKCESDGFLLWVFGTGLLSIGFLTSAMYLIYRHWRISRDMDALLWRIDKKDIEWETGYLFPSRGRLIGCGGLSTGSQASLARFSTTFAPLVSYRERIFAAKALNLCHLDTALKHQLKMLREIRHENLNAFIGACVFDEGLLLVYEYCSRGSIKDILENGDLKLDDMFVSSLVGDLLRGLSYLHDSSPFRYHGNLKPTNCLIDSRWNLKLSDFGLKPYEYKLRRTTDLIVPPTCNLVTSTGGIGTSTSIRTSGDGSEDIQVEERAPLPHPHQGAGLPNNSSSGTGRASQSFTSSFHGPHVSQVTSPYLAPEYPLFIKPQPQKNCVEGLRKGDIYSLGIILWELIRRESLASYLGLKDEKEVRERICHGITIPFQTSSKLSSVNLQVDPDELFWPATLLTIELQFGEDKKGATQGQQLPQSQQANGKSNNHSGHGINHFDQIRECLKDCLSHEPEMRPDIKAVRMRLRPLHKGMRSNIFDIMIGLMEKYANNLEILVDERTKQLSEEKRKTDSLLYELIPASVAEELKEGLRVPAQNYDCVSIYFSDIVGFTSMSAQSTPLQVVEFLNDLYTCFDSIIESYDVYKVETIGDAYMVASGLPEVRLGNSHAVEVANMALKLLQAVTNFHIRHRPSETLKLRIGIHSGPVCAGVVGLKRPRYCLFGDTVNTASRMESTGQPLRIHCSETFAKLIQNDPNPQFEMEERGLIDVKGKGDMMTYWLLGKRASFITAHVRRSTTTESTG
ncbi:unnamed protein product [Orchesella dallaii]|uniref:Guanylate cyclase n=1 Tax=Orchesella dallaii TaxID=48710 RepID=A0ABP1QIE5_9HEXA